MPPKKDRTQAQAKQARATAQRMKDRHQWHKVRAPEVWRPGPNEELVGYFGGRTIRNGTYGQYEVILVHVPYQGSYLVSGTVLIQLVDAAMVTKGDPVRVVFLGTKPTGQDHEVKLFELYVTDGAKLAEDALPKSQFDH